jgi:L-alanine-DL-glutamate epimerase-like enolase superfamily enzyme
MQLRLHQLDLPLKYAFTIARGTVRVQQTLIVELSEAGQCGYGEATTNSYYGATYDNMITALESVRPQLEAARLTDPTQLWAEMAPQFADCRFALCALDQAAHDLWGKKIGAPVYKLWGLATDNTPLSDFTIGLDTIDRMVAKLLEMPGWPIYKIKLGTAPAVGGVSDADSDVANVRELRCHTDAVFRADVNGGWTADEAIAKSRELAALGVEFIEQPLPAKDWAGARRVFEESALPIIADESCVAESDVDRCADYFHGINIKLVKCGGLTPARRMIARARQLGLKVMVGCMTESTVGISAIAQLLPLLDCVDMDGAALLASDIATGVRLDRGRCIYPAENGTGVHLLHLPSSA